MPLARRASARSRSAWADRIDVQIGHQTIVDDRTSREYGSPNREIERNASTLEGYSVAARKDVGAHHLGYGIEVYRDTIESFRERLNIDTGVTSARPGRYPDGSTMDSMAVFLSDDWRVGPRLDLLAVMRQELGSLDKVKRVVKVLGMVNGTPEFEDQPKVINGCSDLFVQVLGEKGKHARSAVGMGSLPMGIPVEIEVIVEVEAGAAKKAVKKPAKKKRR